MRTNYCLHQNPAGRHRTRSLINLRRNLDAIIAQINMPGWPEPIDHGIAFVAGELSPRIR